MSFRRGKRGLSLGRRFQQSETVLNIAGALTARHIRFVFATSKVCREPAGMDDYLNALNPMIVAMWHGQFLLLPLMKPKAIPVYNMVAKHADGEMIGRALQHFDMGLIRGAGAGESGKDRGGMAAFRAALKTLRSNATVALTADIPPGPARVAGLGIVTLAKVSGRPIVPLAIATDRFLTLPTWSRFTINLPFAKLAMVAGDPISVPRDADEAALEAFRLKVEAAMTATTERAYDLVGSDARRTAPPTATVHRSGSLLSLYRGVTVLARPAAPILLKRRLAKGKEIKERLPERFGRASVARPDGRLFWFHAASIGETNAVLPLIHALRQRYPSLTVLLTTVTVTSASVAAARLPEGAIHQFLPLDNQRFCSSFLEYWRPDLALFTESEIWPNFIVEAERRDVPLILVNASVSLKSFKRWSRLRSLSRPVFSRFDLALTQSWRMAKRLKALGVRNTEITGNLKYDAPAPPIDEKALAVLRRSFDG